MSGIRIESYERIFRSTNYAAALDRVKEATRRGLDVNRIEQCGATPLVQCVKFFPSHTPELLNQKREIINILIQAGAKVDQRCSEVHDRLVLKHFWQSNLLFCLCLITLLEYKLR